MEDYKTRIKRLHKQGAKYLRLSAKGLVMWTEWMLPDGTIVYVDLESKSLKELNNEMSQV